MSRRSLSLRHVGGVSASVPRHETGRGKSGVETSEVFSRVGLLAEKEKGRHDLSRSAHEIHAPGCVPASLAAAEPRVGGFTVDAGQIVEPSFAGEAHQMRHGETHARGVVLLIGNGEEEQVHSQLSRIGGILRQQSRLDGEAAFHVHDTPAEEIIPRCQVASGLLRKGNVTDPTGVLLGVEGPGFERSADVHVHHVVVTGENHRPRR
jgi:hypothetical protein